MAIKWIHNKKYQKMVWIGLAIIILPAFVLWGSGSVVRSQREVKSVGTIFGRSVSPDEFREAMLAAKNQMLIQFGDNFTEVQKFINLEKQAWERIILLREAARKKIKIGDKEVISLITNSGLFKKKDRFDNTTYTRMVAYHFHTLPRKFEEQIRQNLILEKLYGAVTAPVKINDEEIKKTYDRENEQVSILYLAAIYADFAKDIAAADETLKEYFQKNPLAFKQPLSYNLEYVSSESEEAMKTVFTRLNKNEDLSAIAKDLNLQYKETGYFTANSPVPGIGWVPQLTTAIPKAQKGEILPPVRLDKNFFLLKVKELREPFIPGFEDIKDKVKDTYLKEISKQLAHDKIEICLKKLREEKLSSGQAFDLEKTAKESGLKSGNTGLFTSGSYIEGIGASDNFFTAVRNLPEGEISEIIGTPEGLYITARKSFVPVEEKKFLEAKPKFSAELLSKKKQEFFTNFLEGLKKEAQGPFLQTTRQ
ncbi:MAG: SurA N-terminal domain-containing protein [Candidatus Omnitrophota bacterium]|jgi:parvulin-like peptidyl-prolyl isomerase